MSVNFILISEHPIQQGIRKGGGPHFCDEDEEEWRILGSWMPGILRSTFNFFVSYFKLVSSLVA